MSFCLIHASINQMSIDDLSDDDIQEYGKYGIRNGASRFIFNIQTL